MKTIKSARAIDELFTSGKRLFTPYLTLIYSTINPQSYPQCEDAEGIVASEAENQCSNQGKVAFIAGKKNGNAVWRNRAKRRMRAICFDLSGPWDGFNVIFLAKRRLLEASYSKVRQSCRETLASIGCKVS